MSANEQYDKKTGVARITLQPPVSILNIISYNYSLSTGNDGATNDSFISAMGNATFSGLLDTDTTMPERVTVDVNEDSMSLPSAATSPNKSFRLNSSLGPDAQWMNGDVSRTLYFSIWQGKCLRYF